MTELMMLLKAVSGARVIVSEGLSVIQSVKEYADKSESLSTADKETLMGELNKVNQEVQDSKFPDSET